MYKRVLKDTNDVVSKIQWIYHCEGYEKNDCVNPLSRSSMQQLPDRRTLQH